MEQGKNLKIAIKKVERWKIISRSILYYHRSRVFIKLIPNYVAFARVMVANQPHVCKQGIAIAQFSGYKLKWKEAITLQISEKKCY